MTAQPYRLPEGSRPEAGPLRRVTPARRVARVMGAVGRTVRRSLWEKVPRDHRESPRDLRRRQIVTATFVVIGAVVLSFSLRIDPGNDWFYPATLGLALVWTVGAFLSGALHLGRTLQGEGLPGPRPLLMPVVYAVL